MANIQIKAATLNIEMPKATTAKIKFDFTKQDNVTPIDITNCTIFFTVKDDPSDDVVTDSSARIKKEMTITDGANGKASLYISQDDSFFPTGNYYHDVKIFRPDAINSDDAMLAFKGSFNLTDSTTNRITEV